MPAWLKDTVFYEIYPQSFRDTNNDGIGDINGIIEKLYYIRDLGCNALWINPCFDSPFKDAGYDVRDYKKVAPRYGCNEDLYRLFGEAHNRGMHVLLDLVPGHTSEEHAWFKESSKAEKNEYSGRYIWTNDSFQGIPGHIYIGGECPRNGVYMLNFFKSQPALNYGFFRPTEDWQTPMDAPDAIATREAMKDVMRFWMDHGCDGFRVDMADSLVKDDDDQKSGTSKVWQNIRAMMDAEYPECALVSEWGRPELSIPAGFHMDFLLDWGGQGYNSLLRDKVGGEDNSFFRSEGKGDIRRFLDSYLNSYEKTQGKGYISLITCNHDTPRAKRTLTDHELKVAYAFIFTMPGVPFLYYGDEIGMRYLDIPTKEGGYGRTGTRTPMQWSTGKNLGFSECNPDSLYLPVDPAKDAPTVETAMADPDSLYHTVKELLALRHAHTDLQADGSFELIYGEKEKLPLVYRRGDLLIAVNPSTMAQGLQIQACNAAAGNKAVFSIGDASLEGDNNKILKMGPQSFAVFA